VLVASGVEFTSSASREKELDGSFGISSSGVSVGPSASRSRKNVLDVSYTDPGPVVLAYRVQKLLLVEDGKVSPNSFTEGAYFGDEEKESTVVLDAELEDINTEDFEQVDGVGEVEREEYGLWVTG
jgi:hypothetical protein